MFSKCAPALGRLFFKKRPVRSIGQYRGNRKKCKCAARTFYKRRFFSPATKNRLIEYSANCPGQNRTTGGPAQNSLRADIHGARWHQNFFASPQRRTRRGEVITRCWSRRRLKKFAILNGFSPWSKAGVERRIAEKNGRKRPGEGCAPSLLLPPPT